MAAPTKQGIDYFPLDADLDQDDKLQMIIGEFGIKGEVIFIKLLSWIYKHRGYYSPWNESEQLKFANRVAYAVGDSQVNLIRSVVERCVKWELFDQDLFTMSSILTSMRIQRTWLDATRKRKERIIEPDFWLLHVNGGVKAEETQEKAEVIDKEKVESKGNETKKESKVLLKDTLLNFFSENFYSGVWEKWKKYKKSEWDFHYYESTTTEEEALTDLIALSQKNEKTATAIIEQSIANKWQGFFELREKKSNGKKSNSPPRKAVPDRLAIEISDLFRRYSSNEKITIISVDSVFYDYLQKHGFNEYFSNGEVETIRFQAKEILQKAGKKESGDELKNMMKRVAVLEIFKQLKLQGKEAVFHVE